MATDFIMPRVSDQQQSAYMQQRQFYQQQQQQQQQQPYQQAPAPAPYQSSGQYNNQQVSPLSTSGNASPTSSKNYITRQVRPLYVPAVLRPTQFPSKAPTHRPKSLNEEAFEDRDLQQTNNGFIGLGGLGAFGRLSRRSTGDSGKCISDDWNFDLFPKPTGAPTRKHWKPDHESTICDDATCKSSFTILNRRHHCRRCGNIFCGEHSAYEIPLDQDAQYNPRGMPSRACAHCYSEFREWRSRTNSQSSSAGSSENSNSADGGSRSPVVAVSPTSVGGPRLKGPAAMGLPHLAQTPEVAHSVPRDWNWSTF